MGRRDLTLKSLGSRLAKSTMTGVLVSLIVNAIVSTNGSIQRLEPSAKECESLELFKHQEDPFKSFQDFYPFYLCEHSLPTTKLFHFIGTFNAVFFLMSFLANGFAARPLVLGLVQAYSFAWFSHFFIQRNKPATFKYPAYSFVSDWVMFKDLMVGSVRMYL